MDHNSARGGALVIKWQSPYPLVGLDPKLVERLSSGSNAGGGAKPETAACVIALDDADPNREFRCWTCSGPPRSDG